MRTLVNDELGMAILMCPRINECQGGVCSTQRKYGRSGFSTLCVNPRDHNVESVMESARRILKRVGEIKG
ncbi:MAG: hypothetical protein QW705_04560 [Zestosphaera sp.]